MAPPLSEGRKMRPGLLVREQGLFERKQRTSFEQYGALFITRREPALAHFHFYHHLIHVGMVLLHASCPILGSMGIKFRRAAHQELTLSLGLLLYDKKCTTLDTQATGCFRQLSRLELVGDRLSLERPGRGNDMVKLEREGRCADAMERVLTAYDELTETIGRPDGAFIEEIQAAVEYLLDAVKVAGKEAPGHPLRAKTLHLAVSGPRHSN
jgi:hypothetical protein